MIFRGAFLFRTRANPHALHAHDAFGSVEPVTCVAHAVDVHGAHLFAGAT